MLRRTAKRAFDGGEFVWTAMIPAAICGRVSRPNESKEKLMKVVAFNGSARKDGNTAILIKEALDS
ncbi:MAG: hypothetical protein ABIH23_12765, partial [bacterium]